jgi:hypothetical protein
MSKRPAPKLPAFLFYPGDWKKDPQLRKCSLAARGAWIELLLAMHENGRTGIVSGTVEELAQICGCNARAMRRALDELKRLKTADVRFCKADVRVVNRRMEREHKRREANKLYVQRSRKKGHVSISSDSSSSSSSSSSSKEDLVSKKLSRERESSEGEPSSLSFSPQLESIIEEILGSGLYGLALIRKVARKQIPYLEREPTKRELLGWLNSEKGETYGDPTTRTNAKIDKVVQDLVRDRDLNKAQGGSS